MQTGAILLLALATPAWGCVCGGNWPSVKQAWEKAPFVFLGTVEIADPDGDPTQTIFQEQSVRIRVDEAFKGVVTGQTIELHEGGNDCASKFRTGQRAVFYMYKESAGGNWYMPACTHSIGNAAPTGDDLLFLRNLPRSAHGTRLSGEVRYEDSPKQETRGLSGVHVKISGPKGSSAKALTTADGAYELYNLPPGRYSVSIAVPHGLRINFPIITGSPRVPGNEAAVELRESGGASVDFDLKADTLLTGRMLDAKGHPITGVCLDLEALDDPGENGTNFARPKEGGVFEMTMMPPGQYRLAARDEVKIDDVTSKSTLYYPGTRDRRQAKIVSIEAGKYLDHLDIRVPSDEKRYRITGRMQFQDGAPAKYATVTFVSAQRGYKETTQIGANGAFGLSVLANMDGELQGESSIIAPLLKACPEFQVTARVGGMFRFMAASPIQLSTDSDHENLKLILPFPSCKAF